MKWNYKKCGCGHEIHTSAKTCPSCGKQSDSISDGIISLAILFAIVYAIDYFAEYFAK